MSELSLPQLYRHILHAARKFPSIKRDSVVQEIKAEFTANKVPDTSQPLLKLPAFPLPVESIAFSPQQNTYCEHRQSMHTQSHISSQMASRSSFSQRALSELVGDLFLWL